MRRRAAARPTGGAARGPPPMPGGARWSRKRPWGAEGTGGRCLARGAAPRAPRAGRIPRKIPIARAAQKRGRGGSTPALPAIDCNAATCPRSGCAPDRPTPTATTRSGPMILKRLYDEKLAQASYLIGCAAKGEAVVIDANRDADQY